MKTFLVLMACLVVFTLIVATYSLWTAFGVVYAASVGLLIIIALLGRKERSSSQ